MAQTADTPAPKQVVAAGHDWVADADTRLEDASWPRMRWLAKLLAILPPHASVLDECISQRGQALPQDQVDQ